MNILVAILNFSHIELTIFVSNVPTTLGAETFANFANFAQIRESLRREKFYIDRFAKVYARKFFKFFLFFSKLDGCP